MKTKKFVIALLCFIAILLIILLLKMKGVIPTVLPSSLPSQVGVNLKYSSDDIKNLILKGKETFDNMDKVSFDIKRSFGSMHYYYKGNKIKTVITSSSETPDLIGSSILTDLDQGKEYYIFDDSKLITVTSPQSSYQIYQYNYSNKIELSSSPDSETKFEYLYRKDEMIDGKDCIFVEEVTFAKKDGSYINVNKEYPEEEVFAFWLEKSTGLIIGRTTILPGQKSANVYKLLTNISFGTVKDSDFELPSDYEIIELK